MADEAEEPTFADKEEEHLDDAAMNFISQNGVIIEVVSGEAEALADADDTNGNGWFVVEVVARIRRCKPQT